MTLRKSGSLFGLLLLTSTSVSAQVPYATSYTNQAWKVTRSWDQKTSEKGLAWGTGSGLTWHQKYAAWVQGLAKISRHGESGFTFEITNPQGKTLPAPVIDCADTAMLLRVMFASWYGLPVLFKAGKNYYGHFGFRQGSAAATSKWFCSNCDYSARTAADLVRRGWPKHSGLRKQKVGASADNPAIGGGPLGTWLDEALLNKRVGYLIIRILNDAGSGNLAASTNLYDIKPEAIAGGDVLIERWQADGIGHTIVIKSVAPAPGGKLKVETIAGWLPPRQARWEGAVDAHGALSDQYMGGSECVDAACTKTYAHFGGGLKRWRPPVKYQGKWVLSVLSADRNTNYIAGNNYAELGKRPDRFEDLVYLPPADELRDELLRLINEGRAKLEGKPSGCAARERRENVFDELYELMRDSYGKSRLSVDRLYRRTADYVFAPLDYAKSATCCWNGSTAQMGASVVKTAVAEAKRSASACKSPLVFKRIGGDYKVYREAAERSGVTWKPYANDERCSQGNVTNDAEKAWTVTPYCTVKPWTSE